MLEKRLKEICEMEEVKFDEEVCMYFNLLLLLLLLFWRGLSVLTQSADTVYLSSNVDFDLHVRNSKTSKL